MATRLSKTTREKIYSGIKQASNFKARKEALQSAFKAQAIDCVLRQRPPEFVELIKGQPKGWFKSTSGLYLSYRYAYKGAMVESSDIPGAGYEADLNPIRSTKVEFDDPVLVPANQNIEADEQFIVWLIEVHAPERAIYIKDYEEFEQTAKAMLNGFTTVEGLLKSAPELTKFVPSDLSKTYLPAVPVANAIAKLLQHGVALEAA